MGTTLYLECRSGISGDMAVGALLDLGARRDVLEKILGRLPVGGYRLHFGRTVKCGIDAYDFDVYLDPEYTHNHGHVHRHRNLRDIYAIIDMLTCGERVKVLARRIFNILAQAEAKAHGIPVDEVHFHEVGAIDSIIDIIGVAICIDDLEVHEVIVSPLTDGSGSVQMAHGVMPVPVPATLRIVEEYGLGLHISDNDGEMVTPTGAAIAAALRTRDALPSEFRVLKTGIGAGKKDFYQANVLRAMLIEDLSVKKESSAEKQMWLLESNIDDAGGEMLGLAMECLFEAGAADVWYTPIYMKKSRPANMLSVLCTEELITPLENLIFKHTTTIGIRRTPVSRIILHREIRILQTALGAAKVKICTDGSRQYFYPEYESIRRICKEHRMGYQEVYAVIQEEAKNKWTAC
ncbi:TIGR00299 family protein [Selenomonas sp. FOBRC9]|uniref:nickel pincer cofactor biosynthesis protein LarC n=1 Tax=Selenomonas sp. FOBRC9 TaxID=936573 RepID=UPI00027A5A12|nr:nickel pincer cofactor biosynthesis protein LarC [Selenomonas sp. FOBRC9]EJP32565.1 TIGR00299 family protein [Selenomonas sp. FOBRC9]